MDVFSILDSTTFSVKVLTFQSDPITSDWLSEGLRVLRRRRRRRVEGTGKLRNSKVEFMWVVGGWWYERIAVTVRLRLNCYQVFLGVV